MARVFFRTEFFAAGLRSPRSPCPGFAAVFAVLRRSWERERLTSSLSFIRLPAARFAIKLALQTDADTQPGGRWQSSTFFARRRCDCLGPNASPLDRTAVRVHTRLIMSRIMGFILALALTLGGAGWLVFQLFIATEFSRNLVVAAAILLAMGAHWLWTDYISGPRRGRDA